MRKRAHSILWALDLHEIIYLTMYVVFVSPVRESVFYTAACEKIEQYNHHNHNEIKRNDSQPHVDAQRNQFVLKLNL